jgi:hypothetical protein
MYALAVAIRSGTAIVFGVLFGIAGLLVADWVYPGLVAPMWLMVMMVSVFSAIAAFLCYLKPEARRSVMWVGLCLVIAGGIIGAWLGFWYGEVRYPDGVRNVRFVFSPSLTTPPVFAFINGATLGSTLTGGVYYAIRLWKYREL